MNFTQIWPDREPLKRVSFVLRCTRIKLSTHPKKLPYSHTVVGLTVFPALTQQALLSCTEHHLMAQQDKQPLSQAFQALQGHLTMLCQLYTQLTPQEAAISAFKAALRFCQQFKPGKGPEALLDAAYLRPCLEGCAKAYGTAPEARRGMTDLETDKLQTWAAQHSRDTCFTDAWTALDSLTLQALSAECMSVVESGALALSQLQPDSMQYCALTSAEAEALFSIWRRIAQTRPASTTSVARCLLLHVEKDSCILCTPGKLGLLAPQTLLSMRLKRRCFPRLPSCVVLPQA